MKVGQKVRMLEDYVEFRKGEIVECYKLDNLCGVHSFRKKPDGYEYLLSPHQYELIEWQPQPFERVLVTDGNDCNWNERTFLFEKDGLYHCVNIFNDKRFNNGKIPYQVRPWKHIKQLPAVKETVKEMTVEEISKELGYEVKIVK